MNTLGQTIRLLRRQQAWSQEDMARRLYISIPAFSKIETGITDINLSRLQQIAQVFNLSVVGLLTYGSLGYNGQDNELDMVTSDCGFGRAKYWNFSEK